MSAVKEYLAKKGIVEGQLGTLIIGLVLLLVLIMVIYYLSGSFDSQSQNVHGVFDKLGE